MAGGLLNIISEGNNNVILTGNPSKTFFKVTYSKYTNFGMQKFRIDYDGQRDLRLSEHSFGVGGRERERERECERERERERVQH